MFRYVIAIQEFNILGKFSILRVCAQGGGSEVQEGEDMAVPMANSC